VRETSLPFFVKKMYEKIYQWLGSKQDYATGYELLKAYCANTFLIKMLETKDDWNAKVLAKTLRKLADDMPNLIVEEKKFEKAKAIVKEVVSRPSDSVDAPQEIKDKVEYRKQIYNEGKKLHARLDLYKTDQERFVAADRIVTIRKELRQIWIFTNFYDDYGRLPENMASSEINWETLDDISLNKEWMKHYKYCNKNKADKAKIDAVKERITLAYHLKEILTQRDAFQYENLTMPNV
jgi:hypothetical protein